MAACVQAGRLRVLYVAPERLGSSALLSALQPLLPLPLVAIDEAHCIAEWGHNFRCAFAMLICHMQVEPEIVHGCERFLAACCPHALACKSCMPCRPAQTRS